MDNTSVELRRESIPEDEYTLLDAGWDAYHDDIRQSDNPYGINNWKYYEWDKGWLEAKSEPHD